MSHLDQVLRLCWVLSAQTHTMRFQVMPQEWQAVHAELRLLLSTLEAGVSMIPISEVQRPLPLLPVPMASYTHLSKELAAHA